MSVDVEQLKERANRALEHDFNMDVHPSKIVYLLDRLEAVEGKIENIAEGLYGQNYEVANFHLNGDLEPLDNFFEENNWLPANEPAERDEIKEACKRFVADNRQANEAGHE